MEHFPANFCVSVLRKTEKKNHENLNEKYVVDSKLFCKKVKPLLSHKVAGKDIIHLIKNNEIVKSDPDTAEVLSKLYFQYSTEPWYLKIMKRQTCSK